MGCMAIGGLEFASPLMAAETFEFRVDTEVFFEKKTEPSYETLTVFVRGLAYDFQLTEPRRATIFDSRRGKITLLDPERQLKCTVETDETIQFLSRLKTAKVRTPLFEFAKAPHFEENFIESVGELRLNSDVLNYSVKGVKPKTPGAEREFRNFADHSARLDAMRPGLPPFPRLELNRILSEKGLVPIEIERKIKAKGPLGGTREEKVRSVHNFNWAISDQDRQRVEEADRQLVNYKPCDLGQFFPDIAAANAANNGKPPQTVNR